MSSPCSCRGCTVAYNAGRADAAAAVESLPLLPYTGEWSIKYRDAIDAAKGEPIKHVTGADILTNLPSRKA